MNPSSISSSSPSISERLRKMDELNNKMARMLEGFLSSPQPSCYSSWNHYPNYPTPPKAPTLHECIYVERLAHSIPQPTQFQQTPFYPSSLTFSQCSEDNVIILKCPEPTPYIEEHQESRVDTLEYEVPML